MKGGVGKSTLTVNLAWHFATYQNWNKRVLVVDLDPQFNASQYLLGVSAYEEILRDGKPTIWDVFEQGTRIPGGKIELKSPDAPIYHHRSFYSGGKIDLIPSRLELAFSLKNCRDRSNAHPPSGQNPDLHYRFLCQHPRAAPPQSRRPRFSTKVGQ